MTAPVDTPPEPKGPDSTSAGRSVLAALGVADPVKAGSDSDGPVDSTAAGRSVVDALRAPGSPAKSSSKSSSKAPRRESRPKIKQARPVAPARSDRPDLVTNTATRKAVARAVEAPKIQAPTVNEPRRPAPPPRVAVAPEIKVSRWTEPEEHANSGHATTDVEFGVRGRTVRRILSAVLLLSVAATGVAAYVAFREQTPETIGMAGILALLSMVVWAIRAGTTTTKLSIKRGKLHIERAGHTEVVDLSSSYTPIAIVGQPGHRRWTVLIERTGLPLVVINSSTVDPHWFTSALYRLRPELRPAAIAEANDTITEYADSV